MAPYKLSAVLSGHDMDVKSVIAPNDNLLISASRDKSVRSWIRESPTSFSQLHSFLGHQHFVNALAWIPPSSEYPDGLIVSAGSDKLILVYNPNIPAEPLFTLVGHTDNVCALSVAKNGDLISGSWDKTAKVWRNWQCIATMEGHEHAVWSVISIDDDHILTASADKTIKLWSGQKCLSTFSGHSDVVRDLALIPGVGVLSCSNDSTLRLWSFEGKCMQEMYGHTSFVYAVKVLPSGEFVSCGEDRSVRIWRDGQNVQTIMLPAVSVWAIDVNPSGDIVAGTSDGIIRVFSRDAARFADESIVKNFDSQVSACAIPKNQVGDVKKENLPGPEALSNAGKKDGQVIMIRNEDIVEAHQWSQAEQRWTKVGEVVDAVGSNKKQMHEGAEYDYVFDIDIGEGMPHLKLPYNVTGIFLLSSESLSG
ncbi:WD-40 repeat-containing protein [Paraphysoderma sedebokerense]|nr:WD-40 repeat-containing protein [Paraphysoderma sedebokerense]